MATKSIAELLQDISTFITNATSRIPKENHGQIETDIVESLDALKANVDAGNLTPEQIQAWQTALEISSSNRQVIYATGDIALAQPNVNYLIDASQGMGVATLPEVVPGNNDRFYFSLEHNSNHYKIVVSGGVQTIAGKLFAGLATENGMLELVANGVDGYSIVVDTRVYDRVINVTGDLNLTSGYESGALYNFQLQPAETVVLTLPNAVEEHIGFWAVFNKHVGENASVRVVSIDQSFDETITVDNTGFTIVNIYDQVNDEYDYVIKQDSRPKSSNIAITLLPVDTLSTLEPAYFLLETDPQVEEIVTTDPITGTDSANPQSLGFWINDNKALVGLLPATDINAFAQVKLSTSFTRQVQIKFRYYEYDYGNNTLNPVPLSETSYSSVIDLDSIYEEKRVSGQLPENVWAETSLAGNTLVIELLAIKVGSGGADSNPTLDIRTGGTAPSKTVVNVPSVNINHATLGGVSSAATGVPDGHVDNKKPLQLPELTTAERDAISPNAGMMLRNVTTNEIQEYDNGEWKSLSSGGKVGIANSEGSFTYFSTIQEAIDATFENDVIHLFTDIRETSNIGIHVDKNLTFDFNGCTYTLDNAGTADAFYWDVADVITNVKFIGDGKIIRLNGGDSIADSRAIGANGGTVKFSSAFEVRNDFGCVSTGMYVVENGVFYHNSATLGFIADIVYSSKFFGSGAGGVRISLRGDNIYSYNSWGIGLSYGKVLTNSVGISNGDSGISHSGFGLGHVLSNSKGYSSVWYGIECLRDVVNCYGYSDASDGIHCVGYVNLVNSAGYSAVNYGGYLSGDIKNSNFYSLAGIGVGAVNVNIVNCTIETAYNNSAGHGITGVSGNIVSELCNTKIKVTNTSAYCLTGFTGTCKISNNSFEGTPIPINPSITNTITNAQDAQGNLIY